jgi:SAM-dependent methyltransferase
MNDAAATATLYAMRRNLLRREPVRDEDFDALYPSNVRAASQTFWTPVRVAQRAAMLLAGDRPDIRVLDVGSGPGKLCIIGALTTSARFTGIEQRPNLIAAARSAASRLEVERAAIFVEGEIQSIEWETFDAFYFFNPFMENLYSERTKFDHTVELSRTRFMRDVSAARCKLRRTRAGTRVVTYHGLGHTLPSVFRLEHRERAGSDYLELWVAGAAAARAAEPQRGT